MKSKHKYPPYFHVKKVKYCYHVKRSGPDKKPKWTPIGTLDDLPGALAEWAKIEAADAPQRMQRQGVLRFRDLVGKYRTLLEDPRNPLNLRNKTTSQYLGLCRLNPPSRLVLAFGDMPLTKILPQHIGEYLDGHPARVSANREIGLMSTMFTYARRRGYVSDNPCIGVKRNPEKARDRYIEDWEYVAVWRLCWSRPCWRALACAMDLSYLTSLREGDVLKLTVADYDHEFLRVREGKNEAKARIRMSTEFADAIDRARSLKRPVGCFYLITNRSGQQYTSNGFICVWWRMMRVALKKGIIETRFTFHDIRAKHLTERDEQELNAQLAGGHTDPKVTARYIRNKKGRQFEPLKPGFDLGMLELGENVRTHR